MTFLGAHVVPHGANADAYVALVCGEMLAACAPHARWVDVFCEDGAFDADQSRAVLEAGRAAGLGLRVHASQLGPGLGVRRAVELGAASVDHCTYLTDGVLHRARRARPADDCRGGAHGGHARRPRGRCAATTSATSRPARVPTRSCWRRRRTAISSTSPACRSSR